MYAGPDHTFSEWHDLAAISRAVPSAIIALISALAYHEIGTQLAYELWIALPEGSREPSYHQKLGVTRFSEPYFSVGVEEHEIEGSTVRIYSAAKTVADCFRMRSKVGYDVAIEALKEGWRLRKFTLDELNHFSKLNKVDRVMRPYLEAILS
jgi:predicted transcriptional regulator of viral defense system